MTEPTAADIKTLAVGVETIERANNLTRGRRCRSAPVALNHVAASPSIIRAC